jgi:hypothetical protein
MPRPALATPADVRAAVLALLVQAGAAEAPSAQSFRRAVSVRKVRERLGGGNPATIGRAINAVEAELVRQGLDTVATPELPADIAALMTQLWQAAVGVQLDAVVRLRREAQSVADGARDALAEAQLRGEVLKQELAELRAAVGERDSRLAQALTDGAALSVQVTALRGDLQAAREREAQWLAERAEMQRAQAEAIAAAQARYEGLSKQLLQETAQQRQAAQAELARMASQQKFADKRESALQARLAQLEADLVEARAQREQVAGEASALRYVNTSLRAQIDEVMRAAPPPQVATVPSLARGRKSTAKASKTPSAEPKSSRRAP